MKISNDFRASNVPEPVAPQQAPENAHPSQESAQGLQSALNQALEQAVKHVDQVISAVTGQNPGANQIQKVKDALDGKDKDLQNQDKLGNFEIQQLMSDYSKTETMISNTIKKEHDTANSVTKNLK